MDAFEINQAPDLKKVGDNPTTTGNSVFDASQYAFFGNHVVEEVELGGLEEEDEILSFTGGIGEDFSFDKEEVEHSRPLSDVDYLASTFSKLNRDPDVYRNTGPITDRRSRQNSLAPEWTHGDELPDWYGQQLPDSDAIKDDKAWPGQPLSALDPKRTTLYPEPQRQLHQNHNQQQFPSDPILVPKSSFVSYPPQGSISSLDSLLPLTKLISFLLNTRQTSRNGLELVCLLSSMILEKLLCWHWRSTCCFRDSQIGELRSGSPRLEELNDLLRSSTKKGL